MWDSCHIFTNSEFYNYEIVTFRIHTASAVLRKWLFSSVHTKITFWNLIQLRQCIVFQKYLIIFRQNFFEKKNCHSSNMASNFVRESIFVYDNPITQIDSISLVHAMVQHITNNFDHFSDDFFFAKKLAQFKYCTCT